MHLFSTLAGTPWRKMWLVHHVVVSRAAAKMSNTTFYSFLKLILRLFKNLKNILGLSAFNSKVKPNVTLYWHSQPMLKMPSVYKWWLSKFFSQWSSLSMLLLILYCFGNLMSGWMMSKFYNYDKYNGDEVKAKKALHGNKWYDTCLHSSLLRIEV